MAFCNKGRSTYDLDFYAVLPEPRSLVDIVRVVCSYYNANFVKALLASLTIWESIFLSHPHIRCESCLKG